MSIPTPGDEPGRLEALASYEVMDTPPEADFDDLVRLASSICATPIALISLLDAERQWFKARVGLDAPETPRDVAFCAHAIVQDDLFVVPDATQDEPGIPREFRERVFEMFHTLKSRDEVEGAGLGLALVKKLIERYGGEITLESAPEGGTTVRFTWPQQISRA